MPGKKRNALLWSFSFSPERVSYLFGTMHVAGRSTAERIAFLSDYIKSCERYFGESDIQQITDPIAGERMLLPEDLTLRKCLGEAKFQKCRKVLHRAFGIDLLPLNRLKPIFIVNMAAEILIRSGAYQPLDVLLWRLASSQGLECKGLESYAEQLEILVQIPLDQQLTQLVSLCRNTNKFKSQLHSMENAYESEQIHKLYRLSSRTMGGSKKQLIYERNYRMAHRIHSMAQGSSIFVAVGAGHLSGAKGLIHLLRQRGARLKPIEMHEKINPNS